MRPGRASSLRPDVVLLELGSSSARGYIAKEDLSAESLEAVLGP
jgi:hypothetical protein